MVIGMCRVVIRAVIAKGSPSSSTDGLTSPVNCTKFCLPCHMHKHKLMSSDYADIFILCSGIITLDPSKSADSSERMLISFM